jgi:hypothetical protein
MIVSLREHAGDALRLLAGCWRFLLSPACRQRKLGEWRALRATVSGQAVLALEILAATVIGVGLPLWLLVIAAR